jgi:hypothetical protein
MLQPVLKSKVWHDNEPKSQLCGPATSAQAVSHETSFAVIFWQWSNSKPTTNKMFEVRLCRCCDNLSTGLNLINLRLGSRPCRCLNFALGWLHPGPKQEHGPLGALPPEFAGLLDVICREVRSEKRWSAMICDDCWCHERSCCSVTPHWGLFWVTPRQRCARRRRKSDSISGIFLALERVSRVQFVKSCAIKKVEIDLRPYEVSHASNDIMRFGGLSQND